MNKNLLIALALIEKICEITTRHANKKAHIFIEIKYLVNILMKEILFIVFESLLS